MREIDRAAHAVAREIIRLANECEPEKIKERVDYVFNAAMAYGRLSDAEHGQQQEAQRRSALQRVAQNMRRARD